MKRSSRVGLGQTPKSPTQRSAHANTQSAKELSSKTSSSVGSVLKIKQVIQLIVIVLATTLVVTIASDLIKINAYQQSVTPDTTLASDPLLAIQHNRGDHLDKSSLPIVLLPATEALVLWDILCLQLLHIPPAWLKTFGCTIFPQERKRVFDENNVLIPDSSTSSNKQQLTPRENPDKDRRHLANTPTSAATSIVLSTTTALITGSAQTLVNSQMPTTTIINIDSTLSKASTATSASVPTTEDTNHIQTSTVSTDYAEETAELNPNHNHHGSCIFCGIADNPEEKSRKVYEDDQFVAFHDINPSAKLHLLIVPKEHIANVMDLSSKHITLLREMKAIGHDILSKTYQIPLRDHHLGFHVPPFNSINHLHLHVIARPFKNWVRSAKYPEYKGWWLGDGSGKNLLTYIFGKGRWIRWWIEVGELIEALEEAQQRGEDGPFTWDLFRV
ncbi:hypothetical protein BDR26DRAFT_260317 [Obelidium mucronatum]|nr:hypothetical protein BDR26DRAFT_260317 [Obelidium mucronatum]